MKQTSKAECPYCQSPNVVAWGQSDAVMQTSPPKRLRVRVRSGRARIVARPSSRRRVDPPEPRPPVRGGARGHRPLLARDAVGRARAGLVERVVEAKGN
jgi:hypothetical protein